MIPSLAHLGFDIVVFTIARSKELVQPLWEKGKKWASEHPNVVYLTTGQGMGEDALMVSIHKDYGDYVRFYQAFRRDWSDSLQDFNAFVISAKGSIQMNPFSFGYLADAVESGPAT